MKWSRKVGLLIAAAVVWGMSAGKAEAQVGLGYGGGYGFGMGLYGLMNTEPPPYYALFPPVYYSLPVARPYGYSPFAYPPGTMTPEPARVVAKEVLNPFVPRRPVSKPAVRTASAPQELINPFVERRRPAETVRAAAQAPGNRG